MENLLPLIVFALIAAFSSWLKKHRQGNDAEPWEGGAPPPAQPTSRATDWEEEMKRLLGMPPAQPSAPPPIPETQVPTPARSETPTPSRTVPPPVPTRPSRVPRPRKSPTPRSAPKVEVLAGVDQEILLAKARESHARAQAMDETVAARLKRISGGLGKKQVVEGKRARVGVARRTLQMLRDPVGVRSAVVASIILERPES